MAEPKAVVCWQVTDGAWKGKWCCLPPMPTRTAAARAAKMNAERKKKPKLPLASIYAENTPQYRTCVATQANGLTCKLSRELVVYLAPVP